MHHYAWAFAAWSVYLNPRFLYKMRVTCANAIFGSCQYSFHMSRGYPYCEDGVYLGLVVTTHVAREDGCPWCRYEHCYGAYVKVKHCFKT